MVGLSSGASKCVAVLGAGATGLTAAYRLTKLGHSVRVFEQANRVGGAVRTERVGGWLIEAGPNSLLSGDTGVAKLIGELGVAGETVAASPAAKNRYIVRHGRLFPVPLSPGALLKSGLFPVTGKLRMLMEFGARKRVRTTDVSIAEFVRSHFGDACVDYALDPFVSGIYAGDANRLSTRYGFPKLWAMEQRSGSLLRAQQTLAQERRSRGEMSPGIFSFRGGLQVLTDALAAQIPRGAITLNASLDAVLPGEKWNVIWHEGEATHSQSFDAVVVALPAPALAQLRVGPLGERPLAALAAVEHATVSSLFLGFAREQVQHPLDGFGVLVPHVERRSSLGVLFSSTLFPGRAPAGQVALTVIAGGTRRPDLAALPTDRLVAAVQTDLGELLAVSGEPTFVRHTAWPRSIPQYNVGHDQFLGAISAAESAHAGLFIGGQARDGISLPACLLAGEKLAARVAAWRN